ncbi:protein CROWDED NUCLEI 4 isoform X2 [Humulus lupulus]|uniref:protein CROWDED NUCLEI 4 isoform X2 n=1 Tax=Humulus lupulus TaxID=3486 RepID=UPI002B410557|nr:protein CROWDED NUCLEI 4 isoform X2 [Humulus lupulus]
MASPQSERLLITPSSGRPLSITPGSRVLQSPLGDETIWKRLKEAGFDEESIRRRDKAALIGYIATLEAEISDHQYHMGLLILENKELTSKYEQIKASAETAEILSKRDQASHLSALAEARKREEKLKKAIGVKEECITSIEKALHEMRAESAETKVAAECKLAEAKRMMEDAHRKFTDAEAKLQAAESLQLEAGRYRSVAERKLQEVEAREDDLRRRLETFKLDCDEKEREISLERHSLCERKKSLQQEQDRLLEAQTLLSQREDYIFSRSEKLDQLERELDNTKRNIKEERRAINNEKSNLELTEVSLKKREEVLSKREALLSNREQELTLLQEKLASKESTEIQKVIASHEVDLRARKSAFDAELEIKCKIVEDELEAKRRAWELREVDLSQREDLVKEREHDLEVQSRTLVDREKEVADMSKCLDEKEKSLTVIEKEVELSKLLLQREREEIVQMKLELNNSLNSLEDRRQQLDCAKEKFENLKTETSELSTLETNLKEEIDSIRAQKLELMAEEDKLTAEKAKFEAEWELIDEKREELRKEAERVAEERMALSKFIKEERDNLRHEKDEMRDQYKHDVESLCHEREDFMNKMVHERSEWYNKMQQERADFLLDIEMRRRDLENCIDKKHEELESSLREKEMAFEQEKKNELQYVSSLKDKVAKELEHVALEMKRLEAERIEINLEREQRNQEWTELNNAIDELKVQREKLKNQRELLHVDREKIQAQIEELKKLESIKAAMDNMALLEMQRSDSISNRKRLSRKKKLRQSTAVQDPDIKLRNENNIANHSNGSDSKLDVFSPSRSARFSWIKKCSDLIFRQSSSETPSLNDGDGALISHYKDGRPIRNEKTQNIVNERQLHGYSSGEPKEIVEVPAVGEVAEGINVSEAELSEAIVEKCDPMVAHQGLQPRRKRRANKSSDNNFDSSVEKRQNTKKRKQQYGGDEIPSTQITVQSATTEQQNVYTEQGQTMTFKQTREGAKETTVLIVDKIINVSEVTCENVEADHIIHRNKLELHKFVEESNVGFPSDNGKQPQEKDIPEHCTEA